MTLSALAETTLNVLLEIANNKLGQVRTLSDIIRHKMISYEMGLG